MPLSISPLTACREEAIRNYPGTPQPNLQNPSEVEKKIFDQSKSGVSEGTGISLRVRHVPFLILLAVAAEGARVGA